MEYRQLGNSGLKVSALRNHFVPPRSHRSALSIHLHRLRAMAEWKSLTVAAA